jgi:hypothetical protein
VKDVLAVIDNETCLTPSERRAHFKRVGRPAPVPFVSELQSYQDRIDRINAAGGRYVPPAASPIASPQGSVPPANVSIAGGPPGAGQPGAAPHAPAPSSFGSGSGGRGDPGKDAARLCKRPSGSFLHRSKRRHEN